MIRYKDLPAHSRVWIYPSDRPFTLKEKREITDKAAAFVANWAAHGADLAARIDLVYDQFIVVMVDEDQAAASGCSIDKSVDFIRRLERAYGVSLLDPMAVSYRDGGRIVRCSRDEFERRVGSGEIGNDIIVFNNSVTTRKQFENEWEVPLSESWHRKLLSP